jgi:hypothetical protein
MTDWDKDSIYEKYVAKVDVSDVSGNTFYYKIPKNDCIIKLGKLENVDNVDDKFEISFKKTKDEDDTEFDGITLTLTQKSIDERIRMKIPGKGDGEPEVTTLNEGDGDGPEEKTSVQPPAAATTPLDEQALEAAQHKQTSPGGGGKRSIMSPFSRQFELPMHFRIKKRNSRSKKSRDGRRKTRRTKRSRK